MKSIESKVREIAREMGISYMYDDWTRVNQRMDSADLPVMVNILPVSGRFRYKNNGGTLVLRSECLVAFLDKTDFDFDSEENDVIVEKMLNYAAAFVMFVNESGVFEPINDQEMRMNVVYDHLDANVTGVVLELPLEMIDGHCTDNKWGPILKYIDK